MRSTTLIASFFFGQRICFSDAKLQREKEKGLRISPQAFWIKGILEMFD